MADEGLIMNVSLAISRLISPINGGAIDIYNPYLKQALTFFEDISSLDNQDLALISANAIPRVVGVLNSVI